MLFRSGTRIVSGSYDKSVRVWNAPTGKSLTTLNGHTSNVTSVAFSSDGTRIVSGSEDWSVQVWDALMGKALTALNGHTHNVTSVAFSSDGTRIVSGSEDWSVQVWDASTGKELKTLYGHTDTVTSVAFSSDDTSGSYDQSVRVWNLEYDGLHFMSTPHYWIESLPHHDRLMWVPSKICDVLHYPPNLVISYKGSAAVDFALSKMGTAWAECYTPTSSVA